MSVALSALYDPGRHLEPSRCWAIFHGCRLQPQEILDVGLWCVNTLIMGKRKLGALEKVDADL
jgi:hypothetical protein